MLTRAQAFVDRKYVMRADERQKEMGLAYVEAERQDLAREIARFCESEALRSAARTGPDVAGFEACREACINAVNKKLLHDCSGSSGDIAYNNALHAALNAIAALPAPAGESVTVEDLTYFIETKAETFTTDWQDNFASELLSTFNITRKSGARS
jgi:NAD(P)-dependent dehydrogenase (short-subunit alcohol dehydrogenase family)